MNLSVPPKSIALFLPTLEMGGAERVFVTLTRQLAQKGHRVTIILANKSGTLLSEVAPLVEVVDLAALNTNQPLWQSGLRTIIRLTKYLHKSPPDVLLSTLTGANLCAIAAWHFSGKPCRLIIREASSLSNIGSKTRKALMRIMYPLADRIIVLTDFMKQQLGQLGLPEKKLIVVGNPIDTKHIESCATIDLPDFIDFPYIVSIGRLTEPKDFFSLIHAFASLTSNTTHKLLILGEGPQKLELTALIERLGLSERVRLLGLVPNPYPFLKHASVFVLSSRWEGYPNVLFEAQSLGTPIVVSEYDPSVRSFFSKCSPESYRIVPVAHPQSLALAINDLLKNVAAEASIFQPTADALTQYEKLLTNQYPYVESSGTFI